MSRRWCSYRPFLSVGLACARPLRPRIGQKGSSRIGPNTHGREMQHGYLYVDAAESGDFRRHNSVGFVVRRRVAYFRSPALAHHSAVCLLPIRQPGRVLRPVHDGRFVAPIRQLLHGAAVRLRQHEVAHGGFVHPGRARPECAVRVIEQADVQASRCSPCLAGRPQGEEDKSGHVKNGTDAQAGHRNQRHISFSPERSRSSPCCLGTPSDALPGPLAGHSPPYLY